MRRVIAPVLLAAALVAGSSSNASAFGLFGHAFGGHHDSCCDVAPACEPTCGCEVLPAAPACGCEVAAPVCGCEPAPACCGGKKHGLLHKLFGRHHNAGCCDAPACGCAAEPACGCEVAPMCGCEVAAPACGCEAAPSCCGGKKHGFFHKLFGHHHSAGCCDAPACGCGVEPSCGYGF